MAKIWGSKFDLISPVWMQIFRLPTQTYQLNGGHDVDSGWIEDVRSSAGYKNKSECDVNLR